jgi:hypothetical protein
MTTPFSTAMPSRAIKPTEAGTDRYSPAMKQAEDAADHGQGDVGQDQQGLAHRAEGREEQEEDQGQGHGHHDHQPGRRPLLVLELAAPGQPVALRQGDVAGHRRLGILDETHQIAVAHVRLHDHVALGIFPVHLDRAVDPVDARDAGQGHAAAIGQAQAQRLEVGGRGAQAVRARAGRGGCVAPVR